MHTFKLPFKTILCPTDFEPNSEAALMGAVELALHFGAQLFLLHVVNKPPYPLYYAEPYAGSMAAGGWEEPEVILEASRGKAKEHLYDLVDKFVPGELSPRCLVRVGDATDEIVEVAKRENVDLIVTGTEGLTGWRRLLHGSVAEEETRLAPCPVLVIHQQAASHPEATIQEQTDHSMVQTISDLVPVAETVGAGN